MKLVLYGGMFDGGVSDQPVGTKTFAVFDETYVVLDDRHAVLLAIVDPSSRDEPPLPPFK